MNERRRIVRDKKLINNAKVQFHRPLFIDKWSFLVGYEIHRETAVEKEGGEGGGFALEMMEGLVGKPEYGEDTKCVEWRSLDIK